jgi:UDP-glucose 4-epimerase
VQANLLACEAPGAPGGVFNIGTGERVSLNQTLALLRRFSGKNREAKYQPIREGDIRDSQADIQLARQFLGYEPAVMFEEGLERTFAWYQEQSAKEAAKESTKEPAE